MQLSIKLIPDVLFGNNRWVLQPYIMTMHVDTEALPGVCGANVFVFTEPLPEKLLGHLIDVPALTDGALGYWCAEVPAPLLDHFHLGAVYDVHLVHDGMPQGELLQDRIG